MVRTQIQLTEEQAKRLQKIAKRAGVSKAAMIRRFLDGVPETDSSPDDAAVRARAIAAAGRLHSGTGDMASRHDDYASDVMHNFT
jgi:hypothetical protein